MENAYILTACGFVGLAIAYNLWGRSSPQETRMWVGISLRKWATRELYRGDLSALSDAARGRHFEVSFDQIKRLRDRGFVARGFMGSDRVTLKGRLALLLRGTLSS